MTRVGITGHQGLPSPTRRLVSAAIAAELAEFSPVHGISSLAEGADQIFAERVLELGGKLTAVIPSADYAKSFETEVGRASYWRLRAEADEIIELQFPFPSEEAYWAAGQRIVALADVVLAVWDGQPSGGLGGTADVVALAGERGVRVIVLWPAGSRRS
jgi:hypothetical protein